MKRKITALTLILAMLLSVTTLAAASNTSPTEGSIEYKDGDIIIIPPGENCCPCFNEDPCEGGPCIHDPDCVGPCQCPCHEPGAKDYRDFDIGGNLYFGE